MRTKLLFSILASFLLFSCESRTGEKLAASSDPADTLIVGDGTAESISEKKSSATAKLKPVVPEKQKTFEDFPAGVRFSGKPSKPNFGTYPSLSTYKTVITRGTARGANFAGKYAFITWACGAGCQQSAIVDVETGRIFPGKEASAGYSFKSDSKFLIVNPRDTTRNDPKAAKPEYYVWENETFQPFEP